MRGYVPAHARHGNAEPGSVRRATDDRSGVFAGDDGYALIMTALMIVPLAIATAFAVDVGAWYAQAARTQRAADAASLAGVVWLPTDSAAIAASNAALSRNWFGTTPAPTCNTGGTTCAAVNGVQWKVSVSNPAPRYFSNILSLGAMVITRSAVAAFNPQVKMGSPNPSFGNQLPGNGSGCTDVAHNLPSAAACAGITPNNVWGTINGPYEHHANGDPFSTRCWGNTNTSAPSANACTNPPQTAQPTPPVTVPGRPELNGYYKPDGYIYAVEVKTTGTYTVEIYDASYDPRKDCVVNYLNGSGGVTGSVPYRARDASCNENNNAGHSYNYSNRIETGDNAPCYVLVDRRANRGDGTPGDNRSHCNNYYSYSQGSGSSRRYVNTRIDPTRGDLLPGPTTEFQMYKFSGSNFQTNPTPGNEMGASCTPTAGAGDGVGGRIAAAPGTWPAPTVYKNRWKTLCTFTVSATNQLGIYPLRVRVDNIPGICPGQVNAASTGGCTGAGQNSFSIRATGPSAQVYALDNMDIYSNWEGLTSSFYLANVEAVHKNKTLVLDMYDPGDGGCVNSGDNDCVFNLTIVGPDATGAPNLNLGCDWRRTDYQGGPDNGLSASNTGSCTITTRSGGSSRFNNQWLRVVIKLPTTYTCPPNNCWWKVNYDFNANPGHPGNPSDHTTWALNIIGDPVHLVQ